MLISFLFATLTAAPAATPWPAMVSGVFGLSHCRAVTLPGCYADVKFEARKAKPGRDVPWYVAGSCSACMTESLHATPKKEWPVASWDVAAFAAGGNEYCARTCKAWIATGALATADSWAVKDANRFISATQAGYACSCGNYASLAGLKAQVSVPQTPTVDPKGFCNIGCVADAAASPLPGSACGPAPGATHKQCCGSGEHNTITAVTCTPLGDIFLEAFLVLALVYGVVGLAIQIKAAQAAGRAVDYSKPAQLLPPHVLLLPWGPKWNELLPLVLDGVAFSRSRIAGGGGGGGYSAVAAAPAATAAAAPAFAVGDEVEYRSSKGWKLTAVTAVDKSGGTVDTAIKKAVKDMSKLRSVRVIKAKASSSGSKSDKKALERLERDKAKLEKEKLKVAKEKRKAKDASKAAEDASASAARAQAAAEKAQGAAQKAAANAGDGGGGDSKPQGPARASGGGDEVWLKVDRGAAKDAGLM